jgi:hypothetical protein
MDLTGRTWQQVARSSLRAAQCGGAVVCGHVALKNRECTHVRKYQNPPIFPATTVWLILAPLPSIRQTIKPEAVERRVVKQGIL